MPPWTHGQVVRMNRAIKHATVKHYHYDTHEQICAHLADLVSAYNSTRCLEILRSLTLYKAIFKA